MLKTKYSKKYQRNALELIDTYTEEGVTYEEYEVLVTKDDGKLTDTIRVSVPATLEDAAALNDSTLIEILQTGIITRERNACRGTMVSESEKEEKIQNTKEKVRKFAEQLKAQGLTPEDIAALMPED